MTENPYERFADDTLILRDELAVDRTILANERTLLAYLRGAVTLVLAGFTAVQFVRADPLRHVGMALIPLGLLVGIVGVVRYRRMDRRLRAIRRERPRR